MTDDRLSGSAKNIGGQVEEGFGQVTGDVKTQLQGKAKQMEGTLQDVYGQAKETAADAAEAIRGKAAFPKSSAIFSSSDVRIDCRGL